MTNIFLRLRKYFFVGGFLFLSFCCASVVYADTSTKTIVATSDTIIKEDASAEVLNTQAYLRVSRWDGDETRTLLKFDLSEIPEGSEIESAKIRLYMWDVVAANAVPNETKLSIRRVLDSWDETSVTWDNQPFRSVNSIYAPVSGDDTWFSWDVSNLVQGWIDDDYENYGVMLSGPSLGFDYSYSFSALHNYPEDNPKFPELEVEYTPPTQIDLTLLNIPKLMDLFAPEIEDVDVVDITFDKATVVWKTNEDTEGQVIYGRAEDEGDGDFVAGDGLGKEHDAHLLDLSPDTQYHFLIKVVDGAGNVTESEEMVFSTYPREMGIPGEQPSDVSLEEEGEPVVAPPVSADSPTSLEQSEGLPVTDDVTGDLPLREGSTNVQEAPIKILKGSDSDNKLQVGGILGKSLLVVATAACVLMVFYIGISLGKKFSLGGNNGKKKPRR